jgi:7-cyano-7-deazaguanine synthase
MGLVDWTAIAQSNYQITRISDYPMSSAVLLSGGLDSVVLLADEASRGQVQPIYVRVGLAWEEGERAIVERLLASPLFAGRVASLVTLNVDVSDVYAASHWAMRGTPPAYHTPDEDVYLPGRNIILFGKAGVYAAIAGLSRLVIGTLEHNPFPDATPQFREAMARALSLGLAHDVTIDAPYAGTSKADIIRRGTALNVPFELTLSCMRPRLGGLLSPVHCGECSKCRERHDAFLAADVTDPTVYGSTRHFRG